MIQRFSSLGPGRFTALTALCAALLLCGTASATITLSTTTRAGTSATGTGTAIDNCRGPCPVVIDAGSGTTTTHSTGDAQQVGIRWDEKKYTTLGYDHDTGGGAGVDPQITCTNCFSTLSWELANVENDDNDTTEWVASTADANEFYHDGGTEIHGEPIGLRINGSDAVEGTCCALGAGEWGWCNPSTCDAADPNANRVMVRLSDNSDPDAQAAGYVQAIYGDGEYIELQHATWNSGNAFFAYVKDKVSDDAITLAAAPSGADSDETNVTGYQAVNPFTDLRYNYSVTCTGAVCIEDITNGDQRPGLTTTAIDETVGRGPVWAFVFAEGFDSDVAGAGGATITITVNDDANGDTEDSQTIAVDEAAWTGGTDIYIATTGNDTTGDGSVGNPYLTWKKGVDTLRTAATPARLLIPDSYTDTLTSSPTTWNSITGDRLILHNGTGVAPVISTSTAGVSFFDSATTSDNSDLRIRGISFSKTGSALAFKLGCSKGAMVNCTINNAIGNALQVGGDTVAGQDTVIWNSTLNVTTSGTVYGVFMHGSTDVEDIKRRALVGCVSSVAGSGHVTRSYNANSLWAYNKLTWNTTAATSAIIRIAAGNGVTASYNYVYGNYLIFAATVGNSNYAVEQFCDSNSANRHSDLLVDSNFVENLDSGTDAEFFVVLANNHHALIKNNVTKDCDAVASSSTIANRQHFDTRIINNTAYSNKARDHTMINCGSPEDYADLKVINNVFSTPSGLSAGTNYTIENNGTAGRVASTQVLNNVFNIYGSDAMIRFASGSYDVDADDSATLWTTASMKAAQTNQGGRGSGDAVDPLLALPGSSDFRLCTAAGTPDASCAGASPCIDAGYDLPTVYYDYSGAVRNSDDVGAWDDDSVGMDMGAGPPVGSATLLGVGR